MFISGHGDWVQYRNLPNHIEVDFHFGNQRREIPYWDAMADVSNTALESIERAHNEGIDYVIFTHGWSTSGVGKTTARSQVRRIMRSKESTPFINKSKCVQHDSVFVAAIRKKKQIDCD